MSDADVKLDVGRDSTRGLGAGADPEIGKRPPRITPKRSRRPSRAPTWSSSPPARVAAPAPVARPSSPTSPASLGALTIGVVTRPFNFEGRSRSGQADAGIQALRDEVDTLIVIPNDRLLSISDPNVSLLDSFRQADQVLHQGVPGITDLITTPGLINLDFADVKSVMSDAGSALMGIGSARGEHRAAVAAESAVSSPLLEASIEGARGVLLSIAGGSDLGLFEINEAAGLVADAVHPDANIIFGAVIDDALGDEVRVTVIAAGFDGGEPMLRDATKPALLKETKPAPTEVAAPPTAQSFLDPDPLPRRTQSPRGRRRQCDGPAGPDAHRVRRRPRRA